MRWIGFSLALMLIFISTAPAWAAAQEEEKPLTVGEAVTLISATDFMKKKVGEFLSWTVGYDLSAVNQIKLVPSIKSLKISPTRVSPDGRTVVNVEAVVDDPGGLTNIRGVRADLSSIGRFSNMTLVDNGLWGDKVANDGTYTLQSNVDSSVQNGAKEIPVAVANKKGWMAVGKVTLDVQKDPVIVDLKVKPMSVRANGSDRLSFEVKLDNPGRLEDITGVYLDLTPLGGSQRTPFELSHTESDGAVYVLEVVVPPGITAGKKNLSMQINNLAGGQAVANIEINVK